MKLKPKYTLGLFVLGVLAISITSVFTLRGKNNANPQKFTGEDTAKIIKPAVVRILQHSAGQITFPKFEIDAENLIINIIPNQQSAAEKVDSYIGGSGFVVNPNGYIITNAHVASENSIKDSLIEKELERVLKEKFGELNEDVVIKNFESLENFYFFYENSIKILKGKTVFNLDSQIVVLNPSDSQEYLTSLIKNSFPATRVWVNEDYQLDDKDVALLKIDLKNLPSLLLSDDLSINVGSEILVFGFPSTAEITLRSPLESTLTNGLVSAIKFSPKKNLKIFQTDAKISTGSSGGPLLNKDGKVIGIITFQTGSSLRQEGDSFAFAIPITVAKDVLNKQNITNIEGEYNQKLKEALTYFHKNQCESAMEKFAEAENFNSEFTGPKYLDSYRKQCEYITKNNLALNSKISRFINWITKIESFVWFVVIGRILLILLALFALGGILKRMQKDEQHILELEIKIQEDEERKSGLLKKLELSGNELPLPEPEMHKTSRIALGLPQPHLKDFILEARNIGMTDEEIKQELTKAGWEENDILHTFSTLV